eukprot:2614293-Rhodomonas_salina.1
MKEGKDYVDSFAPVPHATSGRIVISLAAAMDLKLHSCNLAQAFIQADKLDEGVNGQVFIRQQQGQLMTTASCTRCCVHSTASPARQGHSTSL